MGKTDEEIYPGVELAYPIAVDSYEVAAKRLEATDNRLQTIMAFVATVSAVVPAVANNRNVSFQSGWFYAAVLVFIAIVCCGTYARLCGTIVVLNPSFLHEHWLHKPKWEFKKDFIIFAGEDFVLNLLLAEKRWKFSVLITGLFLLEALLLAVWVVRS